MNNPFKIVPAEKTFTPENPNTLHPKQQAIALGAVSYANAFNYGSPQNREISSVHFFNSEGLEVAYYVPCMIKFNNGNIKPINRENPIDYPNAQPIEEFYFNQK